MLDIMALNAIEEIKQLKARYFQCVDTKDWEGFISVFAPDAEFDHRRAFEAVDPVTGETRVYGRPELLQHIDTSKWKVKGRNALSSMSGDFSAVSTVHHGFNPQITIHTPTSASGTWAMTDILRFKDDSPIREIRGYGFYDETYRVVDGGWVIQSNTLRRIRIDVS
ncbi:nuclear transport factor 2 family protein [Novosphingobium sp. PhB55]|uniref:nuclear transport factor 2 family protein n=1 Tax=Novosphingobium sp. PhB55 TaxID=2485106 RepID=UPI0010663431|nr:nuclear transport factor 2 family protein [Novosphingobium sp. PhB55]